MMKQPLTKPGLWRYQDYLTWPDHERWELIDGVAYAVDHSDGLRAPQPMAMSPAPSIRHQAVAGELFRQLANFFHGKACKVLCAPLDVLLSKEDEPATLVQPDILVVCDLSKLQEKACVGSPNLVVEVVSPSTARQDYVRKLNVYEKYGILEYWIVHPTEETVMCFTSQEGRYGRPITLAVPDILTSQFFSDLTIDLSELFRD